MKDIIKEYIVSKRYVWAATTLKTASARLNALSEVINNSANELWEYMEQKGMKPYSRVTTWTIVVKFTDWAIESGKVNFKENNYAVFRKEKGRFFKNAYSRKSIDIDYKEAKSKIDSLPDSLAKDNAIALLNTGMRVSEIKTYKDGMVLGKGGKVRKVFGLNEKSLNVTPYHILYRELKKIGMTPHMLRKFAATRFAQAGMKEADLLKVFGWSNIQTASFYLQSKKDDELEAIIGRANELKN